MYKKSFTIAKKEIFDYLNSGQFYIIAVGFLIITGWAFVYRLFLDNVSTLRSLFSLMPYISMIFIPLLTMASFAYEKESGTIELMLTMPFKDEEIISGKFLAVNVVFFMTLASTIMYPLTIIFLGQPDFGEMFSGYLGVVLLGMAFTSAGLFASSITSNQITGFIISFVIMFVSIFIETLGNVFQGPVGAFFSYLSINSHFYSMAMGLVDTKDVVYFLSYTAFFLFLVKVSLESRKW